MEQGSEIRSFKWGKKKLSRKERKKNEGACNQLWYLPYNSLTKHGISSLPLFKNFLLLSIRFLRQHLLCEYDKINCPDSHGPLVICPSCCISEPYCWSNKLVASLTSLNWLNEQPIKKVKKQTLWLWRLLLHNKGLLNTLRLPCMPLETHKGYQLFNF